MLGTITYWSKSFEHQSLITQNPKFQKLAFLFSFHKHTAVIIKTISNPLSINSSIL